MTAQRSPSAVTVIVPEPEPEVTGAFKLTEVDGVPTMTSLEIVAYINYLRKQAGNNTVLAHNNFVAKLRNEVLKKDADKFSAPSFYEVYGNKRERTIYVLPERETMLMVMSYDIDMQATVYDAWQAEKKKKNEQPVVAVQASPVPAGMVATANVAKTAQRAPSAVTTVAADTICKLLCWMRGKQVLRLDAISNLNGLVRSVTPRYDGTRLAGTSLPRQP